MAAPKIYLHLLLIIQILVIELVNSECILEFPETEDSRPKYTRHFGAEEVFISYTEKNAVIYDGERLSAYCANSFNLTMTAQENSTRGLVGDFQTADLVCVGSEFQVQLNNSQYSVNHCLRCKDIHWGLYDNTAQRHPMCTYQTGSFFIGTQLSSQYVTLANLCYDVKRMQLRTISYAMNLSQDHNDMLSNWEVSDENVGEKWSWEVKSFERVKRHYNNLKQVMNHSSIENDWLKLANFKLLSIAPLIPQADHLARFHIFHTIWWPNLYYGNWKRINDALQTHVSTSPNNDLVVIIGTSESLAIPQRHPITGAIELVQVKFGKLPTSVPKYYFMIGVSDVEADNFLVFGYNSPYIDFYDMGQLIFCQGSCEDLSWMKNIHGTFRYPTMGLVFCCDLQNFYPSRGGLSEQQDHYSMAYAIVMSLQSDGIGPL